MNIEKYPVFADKKFEVFNFFSEGPNGCIQKVVVFQLLYENFYNLVFGDWNNKVAKIDDSIRTNNDDRDKILATVAFTITEFMNLHPFATLQIIGSTLARTRLYQIAIKKFLFKMDEQFIIIGWTGDKKEKFQHQKNYEAFIIKHKNL